MDPFAALGDPVLRDLVARLASGPARVVDLAADHAVSRPAISRHLRLLSEAGLVTADDRGRERHYRLERAALTPVVELLAVLSARPPVEEQALDRLDLEVRRTGRERRGTRRDDRPRAASDTRADAVQREDTA